jgi:hypothetical protein
MVFGAATVLAVPSFTPRSAKAPGSLRAKQDRLIWRGPGRPDESRPEVRFELENAGGRPVRILSAKRNCGCIDVRVDPAVVPPGGTSYVHVTTKNFVDEKQVPVVLETDSPVTPRVVLQVHLISGLDPPFVLRADSRLNFLGRFDPKQTGKFRIRSVIEGDEPETPTIEGLPSFLEVKRIERTEKPYDVLPGSVLRDDTYEIRFLSSPPIGPFRADFRVLDPWVKDHVIEVPLFTNMAAPVQAIPSLVVLRREPEKKDQNPSAQFLLISETPLLGLRVENAEDEGFPLVVSRSGGDGSSERTMFEVRPKPGVKIVPDHQYTVTLRWDGDGKIEVPILFTD